MPKNTSISIRMDSDLKERAEYVIDQLGLNMTVVVNMLFHQIVREQAVPLSMSLGSSVSTLDDLEYSKANRIAGNRGRSFDDVITEMDRIVTKAES